jgi:DNA mismatch endonuclease (patch repair protein)
MDTLTPEQRSERMSRVRGANTKPEMLVRRLVHGLGYRYRLHGKGLPGRPDLVFPSKRKAMFVHGCFWHRHPNPRCALARLPKSRLDFWLAKLEGNRARDERNQAKVRKLGWKAIVIWECQANTRWRLINRVQRFLGA